MTRPFTTAEKMGLVLAVIAGTIWAFLGVCWDLSVDQRRT